MIRFMCIYCGQTILAREGTSGKKGKCPKCSHELRVPWTLKGRPGIGGTKIDTIEDKSTSDAQQQDLASGKNEPGLQNDKSPTFDVVTLYGEKSGWYIPTYDEQSLFLIAITVLLIMLFSKEPPVKTGGILEFKQSLAAVFFALHLDIFLYYFFTYSNR